MRAWRGESSSQKVHHSYSPGMKILSNFHNPGAESVPRKVTRQQCCLQTAAEPRLRCAPLLAPCLNAAPRRADAPFLSQASIPGTATTPVLECVLPHWGTEWVNTATAFTPAHRHATLSPSQLTGWSSNHRWGKLCSGSPNSCSRTNTHQSRCTRNHKGWSSCSSCPSSWSVLPNNRKYSSFVLQIQWSQALLSSTWNCFQHFSAQIFLQCQLKNLTNNLAQAGHICLHL